MGTPGGGAGAAPMVPAAESSVTTSPVALSVSAIAISGEGGSVRVAAVATAMSEAAPIGWVDPRGHAERKKANSARRSAIWATNISIPTYGRWWRFVAFHDANSARDRPAIVVQAFLELAAALIARF